MIRLLDNALAAGTFGVVAAITASPDTMDFQTVDFVSVMAMQSHVIQLPGSARAARDLQLAPTVNGKKT